VDEHVEVVNYFLGDFARATRPRGVIHVGAHEGQEVESYLACGFRKILLIEANPEIAAGLRARFHGRPEVAVHAFAAADVDAELTLHVHTSRSGSVEPASLLELKDFKKYVTTLHTPRTVQVRGRRLDSFVAEEGIALADYNLLTVDVQGAELKVFAGARGVLAAMHGVLSEVNVIEMYDGGAVEPQIVEFLARAGFRRAKATYHELYNEAERRPAWREVLFLRADPA
jgi:FkbM family methyltransferase